MIAALSLFVGAFIGGFILISAVSLFADRFIDETQSPAARAFILTAISWLCIKVVALWGFSDGAGIAWFAVLLYIAPAVAVWALTLRQLRRKADSQADAETFE
jgi:hypothetical protein